MVLVFYLFGFHYASLQDWLADLAVGLNSLIIFKIIVCKSFAFLFKSLIAAIELGFFF